MTYRTGFRKLLLASPRPIPTRDQGEQMQPCVAQAMRVPGPERPQLRLLPRVQHLHAKRWRRGHQEHAADCSPVGACSVEWVRAACHTCAHVITVCQCGRGGNTAEGAGYSGPTESGGGVSDAPRPGGAASGVSAMRALPRAVTVAAGGGAQTAPALASSALQVVCVRWRSSACPQLEPVL